MIVPFLFAVDFMNFLYKANPCSANVPSPVPMRAGKFTYVDNKMGSEFDLYVQSVKEGSLKRGTRQAVVIIACDYPVGGTASAYLYDERGRTAVLIREVGTANWGPDWGGRPDSIHVRFADAVLYVEQCADTECNAYTKSRYAFRHGKLMKFQ